MKCEVDFFRVGMGATLKPVAFDEQGTYECSVIGDKGQANNWVLS
jgi:hypothetical protein